MSLSKIIFKEILLSLSYTLQLSHILSPWYCDGVIEQGHYLNQKE